MNTKILFWSVFVLCALIYVEGRKTSKSRSSGSGRGTSRKTSNPQPAPTSFSYPQPSAQKPSLSGWQQKTQPAQKSLSTWQQKTQTGQSHSYPSSQTGLSGSKAKPSAPNQESIQRSQASQQSHSNTQAQGSHSYPSSNGLSGTSGAGYPQGSGLSGSAASRPGNSGAGYPQSGSVSGSGAVNSPGAGYPHGSGLSGSNGAVSGTGYSYGTQGNSYAGAAPPPYPGNNKPYNGANYPSQNYGNNYHHPPPPYPNHGSNYGGYGGHGFYNPGPQSPGYFGNYGNNGFGGVSRTSSALKGVGIAGAGVGTLLTGLALWNLARSTGHHHHTVIYDNRGQPVAVAPANNTEPVEDSFLKDLVNCSLTISSDNVTEVLAIPCAIASSFSPDADVKEVQTSDGKSDNTKCIVTVLTKTGKEYMTTIPCATLLNTAAENNVTEPPISSIGKDVINGTIVSPDGTLTANQPPAMAFSSITPDISTPSAINCTSEPGDVRDPINPCFAVTTDLTVMPLQTTDNPKESKQ
ncbi:hornerin-like [Amyelois transitella]|uniref:hornerin-like n=1 Tax=Amyelois transitella TaxID=680683 RepID=UPI002990681F|nr:hornerin-like [Amyelois transitella]